jgi:magnesium chelatase family protein
MAKATDLLDRAYERLRLTARACDRVLKVARTIADLEDADVIRQAHVSEALSYRRRWSRLATMP